MSIEQVIKTGNTSVTKRAATPPPNTRTFQAARLRRKHGLSETAARLIAALHFGEVA